MLQKVTRKSITTDRNPREAGDRLIPAGSCGFFVAFLAVVLAMVPLSGCGGGTSNSNSSNTSQPQSGTLDGNWQFTMASPPDPNNQGNFLFTGGLQGGFLLQNNGALTGQLAYAIYPPPTTSNPAPPACNSGTVPVNATFASDSTLTIEAAIGATVQDSQGNYVQGTQQIVLSLGKLVPSNPATGGITYAGSTYTISQQAYYLTNPSGGTPVYAPCGTAVTATQNLGWTATYVPPLTGSIAGNFHSAAINSGFVNQDFLVTGNLTQGPNIGASSATVTGTLSFLDPVTLVSDYPCVPAGTVSVNGQISGNTVVLQLFGINGATAGQIGIAAGNIAVGANNYQPVTFQPAASSKSTVAYILNSSGLGYQVNTAQCGDFGNVCLALNNTTACQAPITLTPATVTFQPQFLVPCGGTSPTCAPVLQGPATPTSQTVTVTNNSSAPMAGATVSLSQVQSDFSSSSNPFYSFAASDTCANGGETLPPIGPGQPFTLAGGQSCTITVSFFPQQSCPWAPISSALGPNTSGAFASPAQCPVPVLQGSAILPNLTVTIPTSAENNDSDNTFTVPISGTGLSYIQPSVGELDFGAEGAGEASLPQLLTFTNQSPYPVKILNPLNSPPCVENPLPLPLLDNGKAGGLQVAQSGPQGNGGVPLTFQNPGVFQYECDGLQQGPVITPPTPENEPPMFKISSDTCTGTNLQPHSSCSLEISFVPQYYYTTRELNLDYFLALNTLTCTPSQTTDCEIDSGRFPVELTANFPSPLRMSPAAGVDFGGQPVGTTSAQQTITLFNDPNDARYPNAPTLSFTGKIQVSGPFTESDDCGASLASNASCTVTVAFKPTATGFHQGSLAILNTLSTGAAAFQQTIRLRGTGQ